MEIKIYNKKELARELRVSVETVDRLRKSGQMPYHSVGTRIVFTEQDKTDYLALCATAASARPNGRELRGAEKRMPVVKEWADSLLAMRGMA